STTGPSAHRSWTTISCRSCVSRSSPGSMAPLGSACPAWSSTRCLKAAASRFDALHFGGTCEQTGAFSYEGDVDEGVRAMLSRVLFTGAVLLIAATAPGFGAGDRAQKTQGAVELSDGTKVPQSANLPKLNLTNEQREQIRKGVLGQNT